MPSFATIKASNAKITEADTPRVAVYVGATAGIARASLKLLVSKKTPIKVYVLGRNESKHKTFLDELRASNSKATIVWLEGQVSLLSETQRLCDEIISHEQSIDLLFLCAGFLPFGGRVETSEGFETSLALNYWVRTLFATKLLPLLRAKPSPHETYAARVITILAAGLETAAVPLDDLDLRQPKNFGFMNVAKVSASLTTLFFSRLASQPDNRDVVFIHNHPGPVKTDIVKNGWGSKSWGPVVMSVLQPLTTLFGAMKVETSAERSLYLISSAEYGGTGVALQDGVRQGLTDVKSEKGGLFCVNEKFECVQSEQVIGQLKAKKGDEVVWEKTQEVIRPYL